MSTRPRSRTVSSISPARVDGAHLIDRYLLALDGRVPLGAHAFDALEREFVEQAKLFGERRGISYGAWCDVGVPRDVLARAGLHAEALAG